jgi:hypothetical protein
VERRSGVIRRAVPLALAMVIGVAVIGPAMVNTIAPDQGAPAHVERLVDGAKQHLARQLDLVATQVRYVGWEHRDRDQLLILMFELRALGIFTVDHAYVVSRCVPIDEIDPAAMGGGRGVTDFATDPELESLRSDAQPACP